MKPGDYWDVVVMAVEGEGVFAIKDGGGFEGHGVVAAEEIGRQAASAG